jgi:two-component system, chemotaxis family, response regulator Rcp1
MRTTETQRHIHAIAVGTVALAFPRHEEKYAHELPPDCVILNLNLPRKEGCALLTEVMVDRVLRKIPIVTFNTSDAPQDILHSYEQEANCYVGKPVIRRASSPPGH